MIRKVKGKNGGFPDHLGYGPPGGLFTAIYRHRIFLFGLKGRG